MEQIGRNEQQLNGPTGRGKKTKLLQGKQIDWLKKLLPVMRLSDGDSIHVATGEKNIERNGYRTPFYFEFVHLVNLISSYRARL
jgi:hypothetical protein